MKEEYKKEIAEHQAKLKASYKTGVLTEVECFNCFKKFKTKGYVPGTSYACSRKCGDKYINKKAV